MKFFSRSRMLLCIAFAGSIVVSGCVSNKTLDAYETRLKTLEAGGAPDSLLSSVRVYLSQARAGKKSGNGTMVKTSIDSVKTYLAAAEGWYQESLADSKKRVDSLQKYFGTQKASLSGMQLKEADSLFALVDSYCKKSLYLQAFDVAGMLDALMPSLVKDEERAKKIAAEILETTWTMNKKHTTDGANAVEKSRVSFKKDGAFEITEEMNGQTKPTLKEDWLFQSQGTYAVKGDTILLSTQKEKCERQIYWNLVDKKGWVKNEKKPYDSLITDGRKDRYFTFDYIKDDFKKVK
jgi:outer membrane murein-binding lipoprotein Lpp